MFEAYTHATYMELKELDLQVADSAEAHTFVPQSTTLVFLSFY